MSKINESLNMGIHFLPAPFFTCFLSLSSTLFRKGKDMHHKTIKGVGPVVFWWLFDSPAIFGSNWYMDFQSEVSVHPDPCGYLSREGKWEEGDEKEF